jgi:Glyoxalase-like domain
VGVDAERHVEVRAPGDGVDDVWRCAELQQQRHDRVPQVVQPDTGKARAGSDAVEVPIQAARLDRRSDIRISLQRTRDPKVSKERMHLDLETDDVASEVQRLEILGDHDREDPASPLRRSATQWSSGFDREGGAPNIVGGGSFAARAELGRQPCHTADA